MKFNNIMNFLVSFLILFFFLWFIFQPVLETNDFLFHYDKTFFKCAEGYTQETCDNYPSLFHGIIKPLMIESDSYRFYQISVFILFVVITAFIFYAFSFVGVLVYFSTGFPFQSIQTFTLPFALLCFSLMIYIFLRNRFKDKIIYFYPSFIVIGHLLHSSGTVLFLLVGVAELTDFYFKQKIKSFYSGMTLIGQKAGLGIFLLHFNIILLLQAMKKFTLFHLIVLIPVIIYSFLYDIRGLMFGVPLLIDGFNKAFEKSKYKKAWIILLLLLLFFNFCESIIYSITVSNECLGVPSSFIKAFCVPNP